MKNIDRYFFVCNVCGVHVVRKDQAKACFPKDLWLELQVRIKNNSAWGGLVRFKNACPLCQPKKGESYGTVEVIKTPPKPC